MSTGTRIGDIFRGFRSNRNGSVAVEFAIILPIMLLMFFGTFEVSQLVRAYMATNRAAQALANLVAQEGQTGLSTAEMTDFCVAAQLSMLPMRGSNLKATVISVTKNVTSGAVAFDWQNTTCGGGAGTLTDATLASNGLLSTNGDTLIIVKVTYNYQAVVHFVLPGTYAITQTAYQRPRTGSTIPQT